MRNKKIVCALLYAFSFMSFTQNALATDKIFASNLMEYLIIPKDIVIYYDKSNTSQIQPKIPKYWEDVVGHLEKAKDGSTWYRLFLIDGAYADKYYLQHGGQAYISTENIELSPDKSLNGLYEGKYLGAYHFEGKNRIVLFSETKESENAKILHAYGFDNIEDIGSYDGLNTDNLNLAFHQGNYIENCSNNLIREYLNKTFMADSDQDGIDEIWYAFPSSCENPYEPNRFNVIMQEDEDNFHAMKVRKNAGPTYEESAFEPIESNIQNETSNEVATSTLNWRISDIMTEDMYVAKTKKELLGKWFIKSQMIDDEFTLPKNEQIQFEFLNDGTLLYNNPKNRDFPQGKYSYTWYFDESNERGIFIKIGDIAHKFNFNEKEGNIFISNLSSYFMFEKTK